MTPPGDRFDFQFSPPLGTYPFIDGERFHQSGLGHSRVHMMRLDERAPDRAKIPIFPFLGV